MKWFTPTCFLQLVDGGRKLITLTEIMTIFQTRSRSGYKNECKPLHDAIHV